MKEWNMLYDSGEITEEIQGFPEVDVTGCTEFIVVLFCTKSDSNASARSAAVKLYDYDGTNAQMTIAANALTSNSNTGCIAKIVKALDVVMCMSGRSTNAFYMFDKTMSCDNFSMYYSSMCRIGNIKTVKIQNINNHTDYFFGVGSRLQIYGR